MPRKPYPHEELVQEIREIITGMRSTHSISDDSDQWHVGAMGYSPMERIDQENARGFKRVNAIAQELVEIGEPAAEAIALGCRRSSKSAAFRSRVTRSFSLQGVV